MTICLIVVHFLQSTIQIVPLKSFSNKDYYMMLLYMNLSRVTAYLFGGSLTSIKLSNK
jgi:hypothetical protein